MDITIASNAMTVTVSTKGAEPRSVVAGGIERLWRGDPAVWGRRAPLLFPLIGRLRDQEYELDGRRVKAPMHGFCRDREFEVVSSSPARLVLATESDDATREVFPFAFRLELDFSVEGATLTKTHRVTNLGGEPMPFEVGGHEAYSTRLDPGDSMGDYYVQFDGVERMPFWGMDENGILVEPKLALDLPGGKLRQTPEQLGQDTLTIGDVPGNSVTLGCDRHGRSVTVDLGDFPYLGIWTKAGVGDPEYLCVEPWSALPDGHFLPRELSGKPGVVTVEPGQTVELAYRMTFA